MKWPVLVGLTRILLLLLLRVLSCADQPSVQPLEEVFCRICDLLPATVLCGFWAPTPIRCAICKHFLLFHASFPPFLMTSFR